MNTSGLGDEEIVNKEILEVFSNDEIIICQICLLVLKDPQMCTVCQKSFCKKCIDNWHQKNHSCPNRCENYSFIPNRILSNALPKLKFRCKNGCGIIIKYEEALEHYSKLCPKLKEGKEQSMEIIYTL
ncbi:MAG: hypothetical protein MJ252_25070, partial [archaeon]|nr:hypothetical protein [archaeon]